MSGQINATKVGGQNYISGQFLLAGAKEGSVIKRIPADRNRALAGWLTGWLAGC